MKNNFISQLRLQLLTDLQIAAKISNFLSRHFFTFCLQKITENISSHSYLLNDFNS